MADMVRLEPELSSLGKQQPKLLFCFERRVERVEKTYN